MQNIRSLCVYCGSSGAVEAQYREAANALGAHLARAGIALVYGGGRIGLMGLLADAVLAARGKVTGIIPSHLRDAEAAHRGVTQLVVVDSMHERTGFASAQTQGLLQVVPSIAALMAALTAAPPASREAEMERL